jgi:hypothetical protein
MNLIETVQGRLPDAKDQMLDILDHYLGLPEKEKLMYRLCRRMGRCREPRDIDRYGLRRDLTAAFDRVAAQGDVEDILNQMADSMV